MFDNVSPLFICIIPFSVLCVLMIAGIFWIQHRNEKRDPALRLERYIRSRNVVGLIELLEDGDQKISKGAALALVDVLDDCRHRKDLHKFVDQMNEKQILETVKRTQEFQSLYKIHCDFELDRCSSCGSILPSKGIGSDKPYALGGHTIVIHEGLFCPQCGRLECGSCWSHRYADWLTRRDSSCPVCGGQQVHAEHATLVIEERMEYMKHELVDCFFAAAA
jgi:uncharacterized protein with PIN domain